MVIETGWCDERRMIMSRVYLALRVTDLDGSIAFYGKLFGAEPAKLRRRSGPRRPSGPSGIRRVWVRLGGNGP
jgi:catechol 2,3-dioxygenase-like lactoylglutathione lyase family enzyme